MSGQDAVMLVERIRDVWAYAPDGSPISAIASYIDRNPRIEAVRDVDDVVADDVTEDQLEAMFD